MTEMKPTNDIGAASERITPLSLPSNSYSRALTSLSTASGMSIAVRGTSSALATSALSLHDWQISCPVAVYSVSAPAIATPHTLHETLIRGA